MLKKNASTHVDFHFYCNLQRYYSNIIKISETMKKNCKNVIKVTPKDYHKYRSSKKYSKGTLGPLMDMQGAIMYSTSKRLIFVVNDAIISVYIEEDVSNVPEPYKFYMNTENDIQITKAKQIDIIHCLPKLNPSKSTDPDECHLGSCGCLPPIRTTQ